MIKFGNKICELRKERGYTQYQLADMVNADVSTINKIEKDKALPSLSMLDKIAQALGIPAAALLAEETPPKAVGE